MYSAPFSPPRSRELIAIARRLQLRDADGAFGRCLSTVLEVAALAEARRIEVDLVRWRVHDDPHFADHWALRLDAGRVIDPTRVQVDGQHRLICAVDDYPPNYRRPTAYPARLLLPLRHGLDAEVAPRIPERLLFGGALRLFGFDIGRSLRCRSPIVAARATYGLARQLLVSGVALVRRRLEQRAARLTRRLRRLEPAGAWIDTQPFGAADALAIPARRRAVKLGPGR